jgi:hypothetical protein
VQVLFREHWGVLFEVGWMRHATRHDFGLGPTVSVITSQGILNFGVVYVL